MILKASARAIASKFVETDGRGLPRPYRNGGFRRDEACLVRSLSLNLDAIALKPQTHALAISSGEVNNLRNESPLPRRDAAGLGRAK